MFINNLSQPRSNFKSKKVVEAPFVNNMDHVNFTGLHSQKSKSLFALDLDGTLLSKSNEDVQAV